MSVPDTRVTARIRRTGDGELYHEYVANGVAYPSLEALEARDPVGGQLATGGGD
jgi:hypothetical protein